MTRQKSNTTKTTTVRANPDDHKKWNTKKKALKRLFPENKWTDEVLFSKAVKLVEGWTPE